MVVHIERGALETAAELAQTGEALGIAEDRLYVDRYLVARGRLRIAQGDVREGVADLMWCGQRLEPYGLPWPSDWKAFAAPALASLGESQTAARLAREQLTMARRVGAPGRWDYHCAPPDWRSMETKGWRCSRRRCRSSSAALRGWSWLTRSRTSARHWAASDGGARGETPSEGRSS
jgi:hypothetical protein